MKPLSVRARMLLWNTVVLAAGLVLLALALRYALDARLTRVIDGHLAYCAGTLAEGLTAGPGSTAPGTLAQMRSGPAPAPLTGESAVLHVIHAALDRSRFEMPGAALETRLLDTRGRDLLTGAPGEPLDAGAFAAAVRGKAVYSSVSRKRELLRVHFRPVDVGDRKAVIQVAVPLTEPRRMVWHLTHALLAVSPLLLLVAGAGGALITERSLRPVRTITETAGRIEASSLSQRLPAAGGDEFSHLSQMLNGMLDRLQNAFEQQRRFTADASHELRTPIAVIKAVTSLRLEEELSEEDRAAYTAIERAADRTQRIVLDLLLLARADGDRLPVRVETLEVGEWVARALEALPQPPAAHVELALDPGPLLLRGDPDHLLRLLVNLLENASRHTPADGTITLRAGGEGEGVRLVVNDTGEGIPPEHLPHVCERFYRVDAGRERSGGGAGLGLSICRTIAEAHGGTLEIESTPGRGTAVTVLLPAAPPSE